MYVCVCISFSQSEFIFSSQHSSLIRLSMSSKVWVFSFVNCYIKSISKCYHMTLAFLCRMCFPSFLPSIHVAEERFCYASLWLSLPCLSGAVLPYPFIVHGHFGLLVVLTFVSIGWWGECWGACVFSNRGGFLWMEGLAWVCLMIWMLFFFP